MKFIVDHNAGKLVKLLRMSGHDTLFFTGDDDWQMVITALREDRIILTRDTGIMKRGVVADGRARAVLVRSDNPDEQMRQVVSALGLDCRSRLFSLCMECNTPLVERSPEHVKGRVPARVFSLRSEYMECSSCRRVYWKGTHWQAMKEKLARLLEE